MWLNDSNAQDYRNYYNLINKENWALEYLKDTISFRIYYEEAFSNNDAFLFDEVKLASIYAIREDWGNTACMVDRILSKAYPLASLKLGKFKETDVCQEFFNREKQYLANFIEKIDFERFKQISYMTSVDQYFSKEASKQTDTLWRSMRETVILHNLHLLRNLIDKDGFPGERKLCFRSPINILFLHNVIAPVNDKNNRPILLYVIPSVNDTAVLNELRLTLKPLIMKGKIQPNQYIALYDNPVVCVSNMWHVQYYGQQISCQTKTFFPIWDIDNVDKRRDEIGLPTLYEYAKMKGAPLPDSYPISEKFKDIE
jgi:hypothetical protein